MYFFTADQHYGHANIIRHCNRPFASVDEMDAELIRRHNEIVGADDVVVHAGDFSYRAARPPQHYLEKLNGRHIMVRGSHDHWLDDSTSDILELKIEGRFVVVCHYALRTWPRSHYNSWQVHGHSHGTLEPIGKQWDVGVDHNELAPVSFAQLCVIMDGQSDNPGFLAQRNR